MFLTKFARQVDIVEYNPRVKASQILQDKVAELPNMTVTVNHAVKAFKGKHRLEAVLVENRATGAVQEWQYDGVFVRLVPVGSEFLILPPVIVPMS